MLRDDFRGHVRRRPAKHFDFLFVRDLGAEAEVDDLDVSVFVEQNVFELDVSVRDALAVAVLQPRHQLLEYASRFVFGQPSVAVQLEVAVQRRPADVLHKYVQLVPRLDDAVQLDDELVVHHFHELDLALDAFASLRLFELRLVVDLDCDREAGWNVKAFI